MKSCAFLLAVIASLTITGCGGGGGSTTITPPATTYTIGGTVADLFGSGLVLQNNGGNSLPVSANGSFTFSTAIDSGSAYSVTVITQPGSPSQSCTVKNGSGTADANVSNVLIACSGSSDWAWMGGEDIENQAGVYGTLGTAASSNVPGARYSAISWTDASGNLWLFGGEGFGSSTAATGDLNDLWKLSAGEWTWVGGTNEVAQFGVYGNQGTAASGNIPGGRAGSASWIDTSGNFWLFGGDGESSHDDGYLDDLWKFSPASGEWTYVGGFESSGIKGTYGTQGTASSSNLPGGRAWAVSWTDTSGNFWLFGGQGYDSAGSFGELNDLWKYNTSSSEWTWVSGSGVVGQKGTYGSQGTASSSNIPGARYEAVSWIDASGNLWLFGGLGYDSTGANGSLNDLWKYNITSGDWTWMLGANLANQKGTYGTQGTAASSNVSSARYSALSWTDASGNFWLFGGIGIDSTGKTGYLNDLWKYSPASGEWTWVSGSDTASQPGTYGTLGTAASTNISGARAVNASWTDASGNLWLFGGQAVGGGYLSDLWEYQP